VGKAAEYTTWEQVSGYFDGDGNVRVDVRKFVLRLGVRFSDTWRLQLEAVQGFLVRRGIKTSAIGKDEDRGGNRRPAYRLDINEMRSTIELMKQLVGLCVKKQEDLQIALDYLEDKITGDQAIGRLDEQVRIGRRRGHLHVCAIPFTRSHGHRVYELSNAKRARDAHFIKLDDKLERKIRDDHELVGLSINKLSKKYGHSQSVIRRILGRR
jgi:hypothetical protein